jgi:transglutaminase-like putative cysteine protease
MNKQTLWPGKAGALQTLREMRHLIIESIDTQKPRSVAVDLIRSEFLANPLDLVEALRSWIIRHVYIVDEFEELLISPSIMIDQINYRGSAAGDCDDVAMLAAAVLASAGAAVRLIAAFPQPDGSYSHVFTRFKFPKQAEWLDFDPTIGYNQPDYPPDVLAVEIIS